ncbi:MAG: hypothetical protein HOI66_23425 [Verrucomicrobia bacterium]|nr:hypothetical protein [Verrucomicrobiota bacterium]
MVSVVERAVRYIEATPGAVSGNQGHSQTFALTSTLIHGFCLDGALVYSLLETHYNPKCEPPWSGSELEHKVKSAIATPPNKPSGWMLDSPGQRKQPSKVIDRRKIEIPKSDPKENILNFIGDFRCDGDDIRNASPYKIPRLIQVDHFHRQGAYLVETLFEIGENVNIVHQSKPDRNGKHQPANAGTTLPSNQWTTRLLEPTPERPGGYWMRMNPLDGAGVADKNVSAFRFCLLEFDDVPLELQLSLLAKLPLPIAAIISSGGRSYHAWIRLNAPTWDGYKNEVAELYKRMGRFGVDEKNKNASRLSRLPGAFRGDQQQELFYLNYETSSKAIL